ncbi:glycosyltransferase family 2 protein [Candidatus Lokiarchaeum ossiferum]|uniref:glycosyltransferase family 2 protein n=1 Tax=Candidatus Lokiarchaeum ossiferum TaxID=2951803 RepID=UPI00352F8F25
MNEHKILVILPALNVEDQIIGVVKSSYKHATKVIVISDGSTDNTSENAKIAGAYCPKQICLRGKGNAIRRGIEVSKKFQSDIIVLMDSDGQHRPEEILDVCKPIINEECDMVIGSRMKGTLQTSFINKFGNLILKFISFLVTLKWVSDTESGFRSYKTNYLYSLELTSERYEIESELLIKSLKKKYKYKEVPITVPKIIPGVTIMDGIKNGIWKIKFALRRS